MCKYAYIFIVSIQQHLTRLVRRLSIVELVELEQQLFNTLSEFVVWKVASLDRRVQDS
jgi:hypothetical protein